MGYNLLEEKWIPVLWRNGSSTRVGIREALTQAGRIRQIAASNPMDRVAIVRFLLALLYWCKGNPPTGAHQLPGDSFPPDWFTKLDDNKDCFNLLGDGKRFYQDPGARRPRAVTDLIQEIPTGNNFWHFRHSTDRWDGLCPACCALGLLRLPMFSVSSLPDLKAGINGTPPIYVVRWSNTLLQTLLANWMPAPSVGLPAWSDPCVRPTPGKDVPLLTGFTLLSRRVWLHDLAGPSGACIGCGGRENALIRTCEFQTAGEQKSEMWNDPHVVYSNSTPRKVAKAADLTAAGKFRMDRPWPDLLAGMVETGKFGSEDKPMTCLIVGFATDQAKNIDVWERNVAVHSATSVRSTALELLREWQKKAWLVPSLVRANHPPNDRASSRKHVEIPAILVAIRPHVEDKVSARAGELLVGDDGTWEQAAREYRPMMELVAKSLSPGFTTAAVRRRKQIANVMPDMRQTVEHATKPAKGKRGAK